MVHLRFLRQILVLLMASACPLQTYGQVSGQETSKTIEFLHQSGKNTPAQPGLTYSPDRSVVARLTREKSTWELRLMDKAKETPLGPTIELNTHRVTALAISPDNGLVATAFGNYSNDWGDVRVWNVKSGKQIARYVASGDHVRPYLGEVSRLSFSDDGKTLTVVSGPAGGK